MKILLIGYGSRGDVQPLIVLGAGLKAAGYNPAVIAGTDFEDMVRSAGLDFLPFRANINQLMQTPDGIAWVESGGNPIKELRLMKKISAEIGDTFAKDLLEAVPNFDLLISNPLILKIIGAFAEKFNKRHICVMLQPFHPGREAHTVQRPDPTFETSWLNRVSGTITQHILWWAFSGSTNAIRQQYLDFPSENRSQWIQRYNQTRTIYGFSRYVVPPSADWGDHIQVVGYLRQKSLAGYTPPTELARFLSDGEPPIYIGFGSMSSSNPQNLTRKLIAAVEQAGIRALLYRGWAGLDATDMPETVMLFEGAPHDWLFPQMRAVVHHGGAGTLAAGLHAGKPTLVVPHMADQGYWARRVRKLGVGPEALPRASLTPQMLSTRLIELIESSHYSENAAALGEKIRAEDGVQNAVAQITQWLTND